MIPSPLGFGQSTGSAETTSKSVLNPYCQTNILPAMLLLKSKSFYWHLNQGFVWMRFQLCCNQHNGMDDVLWLARKQTLMTSEQLCSGQLIYICILQTKSCPVRLLILCPCVQFVFNCTIAGPSPPSWQAGNKSATISTINNKCVSSCRY